MYFTRYKIGMQGPHLCAKPRLFCNLDVATSKIVFVDLKLYVLELASSNFQN